MALTPAASTSNTAWYMKSSRKSVRFASFGCGVTTSDVTNNMPVNAKRMPSKCLCQTSKASRGESKKNMTTKVSPFVLMFAALIATGCDADPIPKVACETRGRVRAALENIESVKVSVFMKSGEKTIAKGWCEPSKIEMRPYFESTLKSDYTYEVKCNGASKFNLRYRKLDSGELFYVEDYAESKVRQPEIDCARHAGPTRNKSGM